MSTRPIREALECINTELPRDLAAYTAAIEAVRAVEEMARVMTGLRPGSGEIRKAHDLLESIAKEAP